MGALVDAWTAWEPRVQRVVLRALAGGCLAAALPFLALSLALLLAGAPWPWAAASASGAVVVLAGGLVACLLVWRRLRRLADVVAAAGG